MKYNYMDSEGKSELADDLDSLGEGIKTGL